MKDVAARAGVSTKTVSNVVRGWPNVAPATRERVQQALTELDYRINRSAQTLKSGHSHIITLVVPWLDSPYFAEITTLVMREAATLAYSVIVEQTDGDAARERAVLSRLTGQLTDGLIYSPISLETSEIQSALTQDLPVVVFGERVPFGMCDQIVIDNVEAARQVTKHLISIGRKRIAMIGSPSAGLPERSAAMRLDGYVQALTEAGLSPSPDMQVDVQIFSRAEGERAMDELLLSATTPDAVFCASDLLAMGTLHSIRRHGLHVPDDIAVAGFDDIEEGRFSNPTLTTIRPNKVAIAQSGVRALIDRIQWASDYRHPSVPPRRITPDHELVVRESTTR